MSLQLGVMTRVFSMCPAREALERTAALDFPTAGLLGNHPEGRTLRPDLTVDELTELRNLVETCDVDVTVASAPLLDVTNLEPLKRQIQHAAALDIGDLIMMGVGGLERDADRFNATELKQAAAAYAQVHPLAADLGVRLTMKPHGGRTGTAAGLQALVEATGGQLKVYYDPGNVLYYMGGDPVQDLPEIVDHVVGMCVKDQTGGLRSANFPVPGSGEGDVDWPGVLAILADAGFYGPAMVEVLSVDSPAAAEHGLQDARSYLQQVWSEVSG